MYQQKRSARLVNVNYDTYYTPHFFIMKIPKRQELQQISIVHSSDTDFEEFKSLYRKCIHF